MLVLLWNLAYEFPQNQGKEFFEIFHNGSEEKTIFLENVFQFFIVWNGKGWKIIFQGK